MVKFKKKIKIVNSLPDKEKRKVSISNVLITTIICVLIVLLGFILFKYLYPYVTSVNINNIVGKKTYINDCNLKDYVIIEKDKSFSMSLTNNKCKTKYYEGNIEIKGNNITFNKNITGIITSDYNIIINNNKFESEKNE